MIDRNAIYDALIAQVASATWLDEHGNPATWAFVNRNFNAWNKQAMPALIQVEVNESVQQSGAKPSITTLHPKWVAYFNANLGDPTVDPNALSNNITNAMQAALDYEGPYSFMNTLGGLVHRAFVSGGLLKEPPYSSSQIAVAVPISIIVP